jgi:hypothetical protein
MVKNPRRDQRGLAKRLAQRKFLSSGLSLERAAALLAKNRRFTGSSARETPKVCPNATLVRTTTCHAGADGISPYASLAIAKGNGTRDITRWLVIEQEFSGSFS